MEAAGSDPGPIRVSLAMLGRAPGGFLGDARFATMLDAGAADEVSALLARKLDPALPVMRAIGLREIAAWLTGDMTREEARIAGQQATRNYAKRQFTWLRHQLPADWSRWSTENSISNADLVSLFQK